MRTIIIMRRTSAVPLWLNPYNAQKVPFGFPAVRQNKWNAKKPPRSPPKWSAGGAKYFTYITQLRPAELPEYSKVQWELGGAE